jgi:hypothetical protein
MTKQNKQQSFHTLTLGILESKQEKRQFSNWKIKETSGTYSHTFVTNLSVSKKLLNNSKWDSLGPYGGDY